MSRDTRRWTARLTALVAGLVVGGLPLVAPAVLLPTASAATCTSAGGVSVVVDYRELGGSTVTACAPDGGGKSAAAIFASVGVSLSYATRQPGFVCRVNGVPTSDPCVNASPANAYWGLWWADGSKPSWTYSSSGVGSLTVPAGGSVGWSWQQDRPAGGSVPPSVAPPVFASTTSPSPSPSPTSSPTSSSPSSSPTSSPTSGGSTGGSTGSGGGSGGSTGGGTNGGTAGTQSTSPSPSANDGTSPSATPSGSVTSTPSESPLTPESPSDSRSKAGDQERSKDDSVRNESPGDSRTSKDADPSAGAPESPSDSTSSAAPEAGQPTPDEPARVPAVVTWSIVGLLAIAIATSAVVARRRRGV